MVDAYDWPTLGSEGDIKSIKKVQEGSNVAVTNKQKDKVEVANTKPQPTTAEDIQASPEVFEKPIEAEEVPKAPVLESIEKVSNASTTTVTALNVNRSNPNPNDDKGKFQPKTNNNFDGGRKEYNSTKSRWNRYEDEKPSSMPLPPTTPQQPSRNRQERDDRHANSNRTYGQSNSNRYTRSSQAPTSLPHPAAATNGKPISNHRNGYNKRNDEVPSNTNYPRANRNAKQLIGRPVLINTAVTASIPYGPFYYYSNNPIIDTVASIKESIKRQM